MIKLWVLFIYVSGSLATAEFAREESCEKAKTLVLEWLGDGEGLCVGTDHELAVAETEARRAQLRQGIPLELPGLRPLRRPGE